MFAFNPDIAKHRDNDLGEPVEGILGFPNIDDTQAIWPIPGNVRE